MQYPGGGGGANRLPYWGPPPGPNPHPRHNRPMDGPADMWVGQSHGPDQPTWGPPQQQWGPPGSGQPGYPSDTPQWGPPSGVDPGFGGPSGGVPPSWRR